MNLCGRQWYKAHGGVQCEGVVKAQTQPPKEKGMVGNQAGGKLGATNHAAWGGTATEQPTVQA